MQSIHKLREQAAPEVRTPSRVMAWGCLLPLSNELPLMRHCPHNHGILASNDEGSIRYFSCEQCHGFWIPGSAVNRVLTEPGRRALQAALPATGDGLPCPDCGTRCMPVETDRCRVDTCSGCLGVWLDSGEAIQLRRLFPEQSPVVMADGQRQPAWAQEASAAASLVEAVGQILLLIVH